MRARARDGHAGCMGTVVVDLVPNVLKPSSLNFPTAQEYFDRLRRAWAALRQTEPHGRAAGASADTMVEIRHSPHGRMDHAVGASHAEQWCRAAHHHSTSMCARR